jgi:hypothetical protein
MANKYVTPAGAGSKDGTSWENAFGLVEFLADTPAGDTYYIYQGTYTFTANKTFTAGTSSLMNKYIGIEEQSNMVIASWGNLPVFACGTYDVRFASYAYIKRIKQTTASNAGLALGAGSVMEEVWGVGNGSYTFNQSAPDSKCISCYGENTRSVSNNVFYSQGARNLYINCVGTSQNGTVFDPQTAQIILGIAFNSLKGITSRNGAYGVTIYNCIVGATMYSNVNKGALINCNIVNCGTGVVVEGTSVDPTSFDILNCNFYGNTKDIAELNGTVRDDIINSSCTKLDPQFVDAPNGNFAIGANLRSKGFPSKFPNINTTSYVDIGAVQIREVLPAVEDVESGVKYGANGTELTGTLTASGGEYSYTF